MILKQPEHSCRFVNDTGRGGLSGRALLLLLDGQRRVHLLQHDERLSTDGLLHLTQQRPQLLVGRVDPDRHLERLLGRAVVPEDVVHLAQAVEGGHVRGVDAQTGLVAGTGCVQVAPPLAGQSADVHHVVGKRGKRASFRQALLGLQWRPLSQVQLGGHQPDAHLGVCGVVWP